MIISRTPFRISFFGGGTDYPTWYMSNGGAVLSATIDKYCYITCRFLPRFLPYQFRVVWSEIELRNGICEITHPVVREALRMMKMHDEKIEIHHFSDLPSRAGMGSSSAFAVGILSALNALRGTPKSKMGLASEAIYLEREILGERVGSQDQVAAAYGGFNRIEFGPTKDFVVRSIFCDTTQLIDNLMLFYTGIQRTASNIASTYEFKPSILNHLYDMVDEGEDYLVGGRFDDFGSLLGESWAIKKMLSDAITNSEIDDIYETAISNGALGGKILGAGGGGFLLLYVPTSRQENVKRALNNLTYVPFNFTDKGSYVSQLEYI